ncbi:MAG TPA: hypothetical protein VFN57_02905 [Thermomicrobiaceae bacterium]|nr:hypothetical protein [Thermomicrobiaceae bacterium]
MPTGFNRILLGVVFFGLCIGAAFGAGAAWGRHTAPRVAAAAGNSTASRTGTGGTFGTGATGGTGTFGATGSTGATGTTGGRGTFGASGTPGAGAGAGLGFARRPGVVTGLTGTVETVSGQTLTITPSGGASGASTTPETVTLAGTASVGTVTRGNATTLKAGDTVLVTGQRDSGGGLTASSVMVVPKGFLGQ